MRRRRDVPGAVEIYIPPLPPEPGGYVKRDVRTNRTFRLAFRRRRVEETGEWEYPVIVIRPDDLDRYESVEFSRELL